MASSLSEWWRFCGFKSAASEARTEAGAEWAGGVELAEEQEKLLLRLAHDEHGEPAQLLEVFVATPAKRFRRAAGNCSSSSSCTAGCLEAPNGAAGGSGCAPLAGLGVAVWDGWLWAWTAL